MLPDPSTLETFNLDHHGIVAGIIDDIGLVDTLNHELGIHPQEIVTPGVAVKAMILNGLGFVSAPLYLFQHFFDGKPTGHLLGEGIEPEHLSDDKLARILDRLYKADLTRVFIRLALDAAAHFGVDLTSLHLDSSSFHVHGEYNQQQRDPNKHNADTESAITITYGYSREKRPDLKQFLVDLMASSDEGVPVFFDAASGNENDKERFAKLIERFREHVDFDALFIADSALYSKENLQQLGDLRWVTRVPATLKEAKRVLEEIPEEAFVDSSLPGYRIAELGNNYGGIRQRWLVVESEAAATRTTKTFERKLRRQERELKRSLRELMGHSYHCMEDALAAAKGFSKPLKLHHLEKITVTKKKRYAKAGRPKADTPFQVTYHLKAVLVRSPEALRRALTRLGRFILASNVLDGSLSADALLAEYKEQQVVERGFRFLRDPLFFTSSVFLKTPSRVEALAMVMALSLLVYTLGQRLVRKSLAEVGGSIPDQKGNPTLRPTLRWIFQLFMAVHLLKVAGEVLVVNLSVERKRVLEFFSPACRKYYLLP